MAFVDSGLAYDLPLFRDRLARDDGGAPIGYDFWDMDPWPYDGDTSRGAFLPVRHGTAVASVFAREAPSAALVPFRYPRPDMSRMADIVARTLDDDIRILAMPLGSNSEKDWTDFAEALKDQNILAIVSAGNNGRDIDAQTGLSRGARSGQHSDRHLGRWLWQIGAGVKLGQSQRRPDGPRRKTLR